MTNLGELLIAFVRDCRGNVAVIFALLLKALAGFAAISVDYAVAYAAKSEL